MQKSNPKRKIFKEQSQDQPGMEYKMDPQPVYDDDNTEYKKLMDKKCIITGGDSGIGRAVAVAFARHGADIAIIHLQSEKEDAQTTAEVIREKYKRECLLVAADIALENNCSKAIQKIVKKFTQIDILVNNAAVQYPVDDITKISSANLMETFSVNILAMFWITKAVIPHMLKGSCIINTSSVTAYRGSKNLLDYSATKGAIVSFTRSLSANLTEKGIRVNGVAPGPVWTPLIPATFPAEEVAKFGTDTPMRRPAQPVEIAPAYVYLASDDSRYVTGQILHVNGGEVVNG